MPSRDDVIRHINEKYSVAPDYPWAKPSSAAVFRHSHNRKWFALIMDITRDKVGLASTEPVDAINVKCDPRMMDSLLKEPGVFSAYHMNKDHWLTILLDNSTDSKLLESLIDLSFMLTK